MEGDYKYEVRIHEGNPKYTEAKTIYRVARKCTILDGKGQGNGTEYLGIDGKWYHESILKEFRRNGDKNPLFNEEACKMTHISLGGQ